MYSILYVGCTRCTVLHLLCTLYSVLYVLCTLYSMYHALCVVCVLCTLYSLHCVLYALCTLCTVYSVLYVLCTLYTLYSVLRALCTLSDLSICNWSLPWDVGVVNSISTKRAGLPSTRAMWHYCPPKKSWNFRPRSTERLLSVRSSAIQHSRAFYSSFLDAKIGCLSISRVY